MKRTLVTWGIVALLAAPAAADAFVRTIYRTDTVTDGVVTRTEVTGEETLWIGKDRLAYRTPDRILIVDREAGKFVFANPIRKIYVETPLPLDVDRILSDSLKARFQLAGTGGKVRATGKVGHALELECKEYEVEMWRTSGDTKLDSRKLLVLATTDLPVAVDLTLYDTMLDGMRQIYNRSDEFREELRKLQGLQLHLEVPAGPGQIAIEDAVEISEKEPPEGTYAVPEGFSKVDKLTVEHL